MPAGIIRRQIKHRPSRRKNIMANRPQPTTPITVTAAAAAGSALTVTFNQPVALKGVPQYTVDVAGADPVSAVLSAPNICVITYDVAIAAATTLTIPYEEPAIRNASGGFVSTSTFPV